MFTGILQKGDGSRLDLSKLGKIIEPLMGNTQQRDFQCRESQCEGKIQRGGGGGVVPELFYLS